MRSEGLSDAATTLALASQLGVRVRSMRLERLLAALEPTMTEWSINAAGDRRGGLRYAAWGAPGMAAQMQLPPSVLELREAVGGGDEGNGEALDTGAWRWWRLSEAGAGEALLSAAIAAAPALNELAPIVEDVGGPRRCRAFGVEGLGETPRRFTLYFSLTPQAAVTLLERIGCRPTLAANLFFKKLLGLEPGGRAWPKVWVARSVGPGGGWKFYCFLRGDPERPSDASLLELIGADERLLGAWRVLKPEAGPRVQLLGLTYPDGADPATPPQWTVYLARQ